MKFSEDSGSAYIPPYCSDRSHVSGLYSDNISPHCFEDQKTAS